MWESELDTAEYICLSYVWGSTQNSRRISVNDQLCNVQKNLWNFLNVARWKYPGRSLWIDALLINQDDPQEKGHQVEMMGRIYSQAATVLIWLGLEKFNPDDSEPVFVYARSFQRQSTIADVYKMKHYIMDRNSRQKISLLYTDEYWNRAWIVQEVLLARHRLLLHGGHEIEWADFERIWNLSEFGIDLIHCSPNEQFPAQKFLVLSKPAQLELQIARVTVKGLQPQPLHNKPLTELLRENIVSDCSRYQDRIYSLLSLAKEGSRFTVDYRLSQEMLFFNTMQKCSDGCLCLMHLLYQAIY